MYDVFLPLAPFVIQSEAKDLGCIHVDVLEILPPFVRLDDKMIGETPRRFNQNAAAFLKNVGAF